MGTLSIPEGSSILLDAMCVIYGVEEIPPYIDLLLPVFNDVYHGRFPCVISTLTITEVLVKPIRDGDLMLADRFRGLLVDNRNIRILPVDVGIAELAAELRAQLNLRAFDSIQIATALRAGCSHVLTNDAQWKRVTGTQVLVLSDFVP